MPDPCGICGHPASGHGTRYAALAGDHQWRPVREPYIGPVPVPHPDGGLTYQADSSRAAQWWEDHDPDPVPLQPGGGDRLPNRKATT